MNLLKQLEKIMRLLKITIKSCEVETYWYSRKIGKSFYAKFGLDCHNEKSYKIMQLSPNTDTFIDTLERVSLCDATIVEYCNITLTKT